MTRNMPRAGLFLAASLLAPLPAFTGETIRAPVPPSPEEVARGVRELGSAEFEEREAAVRKLLDMSVEDPDRVLAGLPADSADPEIQSRLDLLRARIPYERLRQTLLRTPGIEKEFIQAVENFLETPEAEKLDSLHRWLGPRRHEIDGILSVVLARPDLGDDLRLAALGLASGTRDPSLEADLLRFSAPGGSRKIRSAAIRALGVSGTPAAREMALKTLPEEDPVIRAAAIEAAGRFRDGETLDRLLACLEDEENPSLRVKIIQTLAQRERTSEIVAAVLPFVDSDDARLSCQAIRYVAHPGADRAVTDRLLARFERNASTTLRSEIITALGETRNPSLAPFFLPLLKGTDENIAHAAIMSLTRCAGKEAATPLADLLRIREPLPGWAWRVEAVLSAISGTRERAVIPSVARLLSAKDSWIDDWVQVCAAEALLVMANETIGDLDDAALLDAARAWWEKHENDAEFQEAR